ncbi:glycine cleavage system protein H [Longimonas halophila]|uniref:Glycine cleavage system H protein n=1 Tax=Longimonas halophila TaxID=1469170 RepID=A0A2H3NIQ3_9BACT|nr:glycine cleavage system protein GcvH [Longimonas halophila]PEN05414.1 glycine cleavage system protein H [Longimonas halophila]
MSYPSDLYYTEDHEWLRLNDDGTATVGITDFAEGELGDIVFVELDPEGTELSAGDVYGTVEAVKTVSELFMPMSGTITEVNDSLEGAPEQVNEDPYGDGWMVVIELEDESELDDLLDAEEYAQVA